MRQIVLGLAILSALCTVPPTHATDRTTAIATVRDFYKKYLSYDYSKSPDPRPPAMRMSKGFSLDISKVASACAKYEEGICGWGADGDEYLDTQEIDPALSYTNSQIAIKEKAPCLVQVTLNVYPSAKDAGSYYVKTITYKMVREHGSFVVDDIAYSDGVSTRKKLSEELKRLLSIHP